MLSVPQGMAVIIVWLPPCADIHIGVGFSVARSDKTGQCQSLDGWNELTDGFHAFLYMFGELHILI